METALIFAGGDRADPVEPLPRADMVVAADGGYDHATALGFRVDLLVGDMDSIASESLPDHVVVERHPVDKDATDLELALESVLRHRPARVVVVGGGGGRLDHEIAVAETLCAARWAEIDRIDWITGRGTAFVVRESRSVPGGAGRLLSLIPVGGSAEGVETRGLKWELRGETLPHGATRGLSNVMLGPTADVSVRSGCLLVVAPRESAGA